ncbi:MAG: hypothetical protein L6Q60_00335 [Rhodocyclaceae bacterium]|nr:hypothetical protein [Rhodocyclaceae bacterium]
MDALHTLRRLGFRRWYERLLIEAHAWLVTCFLALVLAVALFESHDQTGMLTARIALISSALFSVLGAWAAYRRYFLTLQRAEIFGEKAVCPQCGTYAKLDIESVRENNAGEVIRVDVCCRKCRCQWQMGE